MLLAVDLGLRTGLALYGADGRLASYHSQNFGTRDRLRRGARGVLAAHDGLTHLVLEGGGDIAVLWQREGEKRGLRVWTIHAERWRTALLLPREQRSGADAKAAADTLARAVIEWSAAPLPKTALRHDAAEAVAAGLWGVLAAGWLDRIPDAIARR